MKQNIQGAGLGLRFDHFDKILAHPQAADWWEILIDNFLNPGPQHAKLDRLRQEAPIVFHSVGMNLGAAEELNWDYLKQLKELKKRFDPTWLSDHLCWSALEGRHHHDLLPLPYTQENLGWLTQKINQVQDYFGEAILVENLSDYLEFESSHLKEWDFIQALTQETDCYLLLDLNNLWVNSLNHDFDAQDYLKALPWERVRQIHLAGPSQGQDFLIDTHGTPVKTPVWQLLNQVLKDQGAIPAMIEWDRNLPSYEQLLEEHKKLRQYYLEKTLRKNFSYKSSQKNTRQLKKAPYPLQSYQKDLSDYLYFDQEKQEALQKDLKKNFLKGLKVYENNLFFSLLEVLEETYPTLKKALGADNFKYLAREYIYTHPSKNPNIQLYGQSFGAFLASQKQLQDYPYLQNLATLDWHWERALEEGLNLSLPYGVFALWQSLKLNQNQAPPTINLKKEETIALYLEKGQWKIKKI